MIVDGREISALSDDERARYRLRELGYVDQAFDLLPGGTVLQNAAMKLWLTEDARRAERTVEPLLVRLGLGERLRHRPDELSMGERQRVMIARALSTEPKLVLADEPTGSLDTQRGGEVLELLSEICRERGAAVLLVTHDPQATAFADRVHALRDGRLVDYEPDARVRSAQRAVAGAMRLSSIAHLYRVRLKARIVLVQELLAVLGLAVGVALLFASQVASASLNGSVQQLTSEIVGNIAVPARRRATRGGFDERLLGEVQRLPGVSAAMPVLEERVNAIGPAGQQAVDLIGVDPRLALRGSPLLAAFPLRPARPTSGRSRCPRRSREAIGASSLQPIKLQIGASIVTAPSSAPTLQCVGDRGARRTARSRSRRWPTRRSSPACGGGSRASSSRRDPGASARCGRAW